MCRYFSKSSRNGRIFFQILKVYHCTGKGLFNELIELIKILELVIDNIRGQGYNNGSKMKGKHQGVRYYKQILKHFIHQAVVMVKI